MQSTNVVSEYKIVVTDEYAKRMQSTNVVSE